MVVEFLTTKLTELIISHLGKNVGANIIEKFILKRKLKKIKNFRREYDDTQIDTHAFQEFLKLEKTQFLIFDYLFSSKFNTTSKQDMVNNLSLLAKEYINNIYNSQGRANLSDEKNLEDYFNFIIDELINFRDQELSGTQKSIVASIQNSIMESNKDLKEYIDNKYIDIENYSLAKHLTDEKIDELLERSIESLGGRYNPKANIETLSKDVIKSLLFEEEIKVFIKENKDLIVEDLNSILLILEKVNSDEFKLFNKKYEFLKNINLNKEVITKFDSFDKAMYFKENFSSLVAALRVLRNSLQEFKYIFKKFGDNKLNKDIQELVSNLINTIEDVDNYLYELKPQLINNPYLVIYGEGGIGKSHLLADIAEEKRKLGHIAFLFLGQHFTSQQQPFQQMFDFLEYKGDSDNFLSEINARANRSNKKALIFIDALNEGQGKYFWKSYIVDFIAKIKKYPNLVLVLSIRTNFIKSIFPDDFLNEKQVTFYEHQGFLNLTLEELMPFLNYYYKVNPLIVPTLQSECRNPLFLKLYCEVASEKGFDPSLGWSITSVVSRYIKKVNTYLSFDQRFPFVEHIELVKEALINIAKRMLEVNNNFLSINEAQDIISGVAKKYTEGYRLFLYGLLEENLLSISKSYQGQENVYFNYERFGDIFISFELVNKIKSTQYESIGLNKIDVNYEPNIYEALSIVAPEIIGIELFEILNREKIEVTYTHVESFIRGLAWRKTNSISDKTIFYIEKGMEQDLDLVHLIYEQLILLSYSNNNLLNADYLHEQLIKMSLPQRDSKWTIYINNRPDIINRVLELANFNSNFTEKITVLFGTTVTWLLTSSNRLLRDRATHTLVNILKEKMEIVILLLEKFKNVNDPYVLERLYAAIYGACLRTEQTDFHSDICEYINAEIFRKDEVYPHALLRDYARGIVLYSHYRGLYKVENEDDINPPYNSEWYQQIPTLEEIDELKLLYPEKKYGKKSYSIRAILSSMTTEYGRDIGGYGDFGRYVFQSALSDWSNQFDVQELSNIATMKIFGLGYDIDTHGEYDLMSGRYFDRFSNTAERIGKKYQWIAFHELLARLSDNFPVYKEEKEYTEEYELQLEKDFERFMETIKDLRDEVDDDKDEDLISSEINLDPEKHLKSIKRIEKTYRGTWDPFIRDIDPTILINKKTKQESTLLNFKLPEQSNKEWVHKELNSAAEFFEMEYDSTQYMSLGSMYSNKREKNSEYKNRDEIFIKTKALFVDKDKLETFKQMTLQERGSNGVSWRESYQIYAFEHFWHPSYEEFVNEYADEEQKQPYVQEAVWSYLWENNYDYGTDERNSISYLMPDASLVKFFNLTQKTEGMWVDEQGVKIALDASLFGYESCLLFDKQKIEEYLSHHNLSLFWKVYIEKVSEGNYHEWWLLYELNDGTYSQYILDEGNGKLRY